MSLFQFSGQLHTCLFSGDTSMAPTVSRIRSARVLLPWSMCATIEKFLIFSGGKFFRSTSRIVCDCFDFSQNVLLVNLTFVTPTELLRGDIKLLRIIIPLSFHFQPIHIKTNTTISYMTSYCCACSNISILLSAKKQTKEQQTD